MHQIRACTGVLVLVVAFPVGAAEDKPLTRIAFGSCVHQDKPQPIWEAILKTRPELFLYIGDNIYADTEDMTAMRKMYAQLAAQPGYEKLKKTCPILATWDDHDYGVNDGGAEYPKKKESQQIFLDFFGVPKDSPRRKQEGVYNSTVFGPAGKRVQVILLDTRYHRSALKKDLKRPRFLGQYVATDDPKATVLGEVQWKWLKEQLEVPAQVRLLCSSIQVVAEDHGFEKWMNMPRERERLLRLIRETKAAGLVVLSGDRHLAELSSMEAGIGYPLFDLTSSGMNQGNRTWRRLETNRHRVATMNVGNNFGMIRIDWTRPDPIIGLEIHDEEGDVTIRQKIPLSRLQPRASALKPIPTGGGANLAAEARKHLDQEWKVELTVQATGASKTKSFIYLNSESDFRSESNLAIVLDMKTLRRQFEEAKIGDPRKHYAGKKIRVAGKVTLFSDRPQIRVTKLAQITILD